MTAKPYANGNPQLLATHEFLPIPLEFPHLAETIHILLQLQTKPIPERLLKARLTRLEVRGDGFSPGDES